MSIATVYAEQIPSTIEYLCKALEMTDPWVKFMFDQMRSKALMLNRLENDDVIIAGSTSVATPIEETKFNDSGFALKNITLSQLINVEESKKNNVGRKRKLDQKEVVNSTENEVQIIDSTNMKKRRIVAPPQKKIVVKP